MTLKASTGLRNYLLDTGSLHAALNLGFVDIYSGTVPATADASIGSAVKLCRLSVSGLGTGLTMEAAAAAGVLLKAAAEVWQGTNIGAGGTATFYRHVAVGDTGASSTTERRVQGSCGLAGADMNLSSVNLAASPAIQSLDYYALALPTL